MNPLTRRTFLIGSVLAGATAVTAAGLPQASAGPGATAATAMAQVTPRAIVPRRPHLLVAGRSPDYHTLVQAAVEALGGAKVLAHRGERLVIKPTLAYNRQPGQGGNVHPEVLRATVELALDAGAAQVLVFDRTGLRAADAYRVSGAYLALHRLGDPRVRLLELTDADFVPLSPVGLPEEQAAQIAGYRVCRPLLEADRLINLASARTHPTWQVALGMANLLGLIGGGPADAGWRQRQYAELAVVASALRPDLTLLDSTRAVVRNGPMGLGPDDVARWDALVASRDLLAVEAYGARLFGLAPADLPHLDLAAHLGIGSPHLTRARVVEL